MHISLSFQRNSMSIVLKTIFDLNKYYILVKEKILLVITYPAVFDQVYCNTGKKK
jgi:hypothetical protein